LPLAADREKREFPEGSVDGLQHKQSSG